MEKPTSEQAILWEEVISQKWIQFRSILLKGLTQHSQPIIHEISIANTARVLDVGCGLGDTSIEWGKRVPQGEVLGMDLSRSFIQCACEDAQESGLSHVRFEVADAGVHTFCGDYDLLYSRFGCMFFDQPVIGFRNMHRALKPGGQMILHVWREREYNPWFTEAKPAVLEMLPEPEDAGPPDGPGPFAMAGREYSEAILREAGFKNVEFQVIDLDMYIGSSLEEAITFQMANGPVGQVIREAGDLAVKLNDELREAVAEVLKPYQRTDGSVWMPSSSWLITAQNA